MKRLLLTTALVLAFTPVYGQQQQGAPAKPVATLPADAPIKTELDKVFTQLGDQVKEADGLLAHLRETANKKPEDIVAEVRNSAHALSILTDRLKQNGDIAGNLAAVRTAAAIHLKRVQELPKGAMEEEDRTKIIEAWTAVLQGADNAQVSMETMRSSLLAALGRLRMRSMAIGEMVLANQYQQAIDSFTRWIGELKNTVDSLHQIIGTPGS